MLFSSAKRRARHKELIFTLIDAALTPEESSQLADIIEKLAKKNVTITFYLEV